MTEGAREQEAQILIHEMGDHLSWLAVLDVILVALARGEAHGRAQVEAQYCEKCGRVRPIGVEQPWVRYCYDCRMLSKGAR